MEKIVKYCVQHLIIAIKWVRSARGDCWTFHFPWIWRRCYGDALNIAWCRWCRTTTTILKFARFPEHRKIKRQWRRCKHSSCENRRNSFTPWIFLVECRINYILTTHQHRKCINHVHTHALCAYPSSSSINRAGFRFTAVSTVSKTFRISNRVFLVTKDMSFSRLNILQHQCMYILRHYVVILVMHTQFYCTWTRILMRWLPKR